MKLDNWAKIEISEISGNFGFSHPEIIAGLKFCILQNSVKNIFFLRKFFFLHKFEFSKGINSRGLVEAATASLKKMNIPLKGRSPFAILW
jgi:hypothetical protein